MDMSSSSCSSFESVAMWAIFFGVVLAALVFAFGILDAFLDGELATFVKVWLKRHHPKSDD